MYGQRLPKVWGAILVLLAVPQVGASSGLIEPTRQAITRAIEFLQEAQQPDGSFPLHWCWDEAMTNCMTFYAPMTVKKSPSDLVTSSLPTAMVLASLLALEDPRTSPIVENGTKFVQAQMDADGLFGAYPMFSPTVGPQCTGEIRNLYVTAINRSVLDALGIPLPSILPRLATYQRSDGTFYQFAIPPQEVELVKAGWPAHVQFLRDDAPLMQVYGPTVLELMDRVEPVTNALMFEYLLQHGQAPAALCDYLVRVSKQERVLAHPVHPHPIAQEHPYRFVYTVSRAYRQGARCLESAKTALSPRLLQEQRSDGSWGSVLDTALAASSLMNFGYSGDALEQAVAFLLAHQQPDGSWKRGVVWTIKSGRARAGSEEISTGFVLEALGKYLKLRRAASL